MHEGPVCWDACGQGLTQMASQIPSSFVAVMLMLMLKLKLIQDEGRKQWVHARRKEQHGEQQGPSM